MTAPDTTTPEPDPALADLDDEGQVALLVNTFNGLTPEDEDIEQPPQDPNWVPPTEVQ